MAYPPIRWQQQAVSWSSGLLLVASALLAGCAGSATPIAAPTRTPHPPPVVPTRLTATEREEIFNTVWQTVNDDYFDPAFGGMDWQATATNTGRSWRPLTTTTPSGSTC